MDRRVQEDGTIVIGGQVVPTGGSQPTIASVVSYSGNTNLQSTNVEAALDELDNEKAPMTHTHDDRYFTEVEVTNLLAAKSDTTHNHDTRYYTESEIDAKIVVLNNSIAGKANTVHSHDDLYYTEAEVDAKIAAALATTELHDNPKFDVVTMSTDGPGGDVVASRLYPTGWGNFWGNGNAGERPILSADNVEVHTPGGYSLKMVLPGASSGQTMNGSVFGVSPGSIVSVEAWMKGNGPYGLITLMTNVDSDPDFFNPGTISADTALTVGTSTWQRLQLTITVPANHNRCRMMVRGYTGAPGAPGTLWWDDTRSSMQIIPPSGVVTGEMKQYPAGAVPSGYLEANGGSFSATTYPALAALYGDKYGTHSGDTYYLPKKNRVHPDTDWAALPLLNGWVNYANGHAPAQWRRFNNRLELRGLIVGSSRTAGVIANFPLAFRQAAATGTHLHVGSSDSSVTRIDTNSNGDLVWVSGGVGFLSLDQIGWDCDQVPGTIMTIIKAA